MQNPILKLFDEKYVLSLFRKKVLPLYPDFVDIKKIKILPKKEYVWTHTYHVVIEFEVFFTTRNKKIKKLPIFVTAHSDENRKNVYESLVFLWNHGFNNGYLTIPHPLFYSGQFNGAFYRGANGRNLYNYIRKHDRETIEKILPKTARWFVKLHKIPAEKGKNFNPKNSRIRTTIPGTKNLLEKIREFHPEYHEFFKNAYASLIKKEEEFLKKTSKRWLTHGDAHPENIIKMGKKKIAAIDFSDLCLSDFARDIGSFLQQLEYMSDRKIGDKDYSQKLKNIFLENYLFNAKIKMDESLRGRIDNYYNWTAIRTAVYFLIKDKPEPERAGELIKKLQNSLKL